MFSAPSFAQCTLEPGQLFPFDNNKNGIDWDVCARARVWLLSIDTSGSIRRHLLVQSFQENNAAHSLLSIAVFRFVIDEDFLSIVRFSVLLPLTAFLLIFSSFDGNGSEAAHTYPRTFTKNGGFYNV